MSNSLTFEILNIILRIFYRRYDDLKIVCAKFQRNLFIIEREIDEKHALQIYQNECCPGYSIENNEADLCVHICFCNFQVVNIEGIRIFMPSQLKPELSVCLFDHKLVNNFVWLIFRGDITSCCMGDVSPSG